MGLQINHNIAAMNAWRNLGVSNSYLSKSLEKLSSGYRINRGADDPAGLLISETLRAQIGGLDQAVKNASDAISMVQTAEGALTEMNNMLNSIRTLAVHAANTGANDTSSIAADQTAVDKAVESIQRIATTTEFAGKSLLDGSAGTSMSIKNTTNIDAVTVGQTAESALIDINITTSAERAEFFASANTSGGVYSTTTTMTVWIENSGTAGTIGVYSIVADDTTNACIAAMINSDSSNTGIWASLGDNSQIGIYSCAFGDHIKLRLATTSVITSGAVINYSDTGVDIVASIDTSGTGTSDLSGSGLVIYGSSTSNWAGTYIHIASGQNSTQSLTDALSIVTGNLEFALTDDADSSNIVSLGISDMRQTQIGTSATLGNSNGLSDIKDGQTYDLDSDAANAVVIIDQAINDVSNERASLGAFQKYTLETTINNLGVTKENLTASESRVRDVDMASEMMEFTKNQILVQAGTAMLAQANQLPQSVLQLLG